MVFMYFGILDVAARPLESDVAFVVLEFSGSNSEVDFALDLSFLVANMTLSTMFI